MSVVKQTLEAAAAAALATSFFAFPIGLAAMDPGVPVTHVPPTMSRVASIEASMFLPTEDAPSEAAAPSPGAPDPATSPEAPAGSTPTQDTTPTASDSAPKPLSPTLADRTRRALHPAIQAHATSKARTQRKGRKRRCIEPDPRIERKGEGRWSIDRDLVDTYTGDLKAAASLAWVGWHRDGEGEIAGFKVKRIRCGSVLHQAGFRNGDIITAINGRPVTTIPQALSAYRKLRKKRTLDVDLERRGASRRLRYRLT